MSTEFHATNEHPEGSQAELTAQIPRLRLRAEALEREALALRKVIAGLEELAGEVHVREMRFEAHRTPFYVAPLDDDGPRGPQAVLRVMKESPHRTWKVVELKRELLERGWARTPKAVEANIKRLRLAGDVISPSYGFYRLSQGALLAVEGQAA